MQYLKMRLATALFLVVAAVGLSVLVERVHADDEDNNSGFEFVGQVTAMPSSGFVGDWTVGSRTVHVTSSTIIDQEDGNIVLGSLVEVKGTVRQDGSVDATKIEAEDEPDEGPSPSPTPSPSPGCHEFEGTIQSLPNTQGFIGDWTVGTLTVHVTSSTVIRTADGATVSLGAPVEITGCMLQDGTVDASRIEVRRVTPPTNPPCFEFFGRIQTLPNTQGFIGDWTVGGRTVHVTSSTILRTEEGSIAVGSFVEVKGCLQQDGSLNATLIEVERNANNNVTPFFEFFGTVQTLPAQGFTGDWTVSGRTIHVTSSTQIERGERPLVVGSFVRILGALQADGSINATRIQVKRSRDTGRRVNFFEFFGQVNALPAATNLVGDWNISNVTVHVTSSTQIVREANQAVAVGSRVVVVGTQRPDLSLDAVKIRVLNSVEAAREFVRQNYRDFLNREPDDEGLAYWTEQITRCGNDRDCINARRTDVSAAFFISDEFQQTGFFIYRLYVVSFGRRPQLAEFLPDTLTVAKNIGGGLSGMEANKQAFVDDWVTHPAFAAIYDSKTNAQYVDILFANAGITPSQAERNQLVQGLNNGTETRASVLRKIVENQAFYQREYNRAFVLMQYFGYLRREPDEGGLQFWLNVLNNRVPGNFKAMVCAFATSAEYQQRFSNTFTHTNRECGR